jgi:hypothetical protein
MQKRISTSIFLAPFTLLGQFALGLGITQTSGDLTSSLQSFASSITQTSGNLTSSRQGLAIIPAPILTPFPTGDATTNQACSWVSNTLRFCNEITSGFLTASYMDQRSCLCGISTTVSQSVFAMFDGEVSLCADYVFTAVPSDYAGLTSLEGFCFSTPNTLQITSTTSSTPSTTTGSSRATCCPGSPGGDGIRSKILQTPTPDKPANSIKTLVMGRLQEYLWVVEQQHFLQDLGKLAPKHP